MKDTIVINIAGGPGVGKTTVAAKVFAKLKERNYEVENVSEFAKELVWEHREEAFNDRLYMHAEQNHRLLQMNGKLDFIITDSPLFLTAVYNRFYLKDKYPESYNKMIDDVTRETFKLYNNRIYYIKRSTIYQNIGRREDEDAAIETDEAIIKYLNDNHYKYTVLDIDNAAEEIIKDLL